MLVNQLAVFLENRPGRLLALSKALSERNIDLVSLNIADTADFGIVRILTSDNASAKEALKAAGFTVKESQLIGIEVDNVPGGLTRVLEVLAGSEIDIEYLYSYSAPKDNKAVILFKTNDIELAQNILKKHNM